MATKSPTEYGPKKCQNLVEELGKIQAAKAELEKKEKEIKEDLYGCKMEAIESDNFRAVISRGLTRKSLDEAAIRELLTPKQVEKFEKTCIKVSAPYNQVRIFGRTGEPQK